MGVVIEQGCVRCVDQPFEAAVLHAPVWKLEILDGATPDAVACATRRIAARALSDGVILLACRVAAERQDLIDVLRAAAFRKVEEFVRYAKPTHPVPNMPSNVEPARVEDHEAIIALGEAAFAQDRFHLEPAIGVSKARALKRQWIANDLSGRADAAFVVRDERDRVAGFNLLLLRDQQALIDLIAVAPWAQRRGYGRALAFTGLAWAAGRGARTLRLGTQKDNAASNALYRSMGFSTLGCWVTLHLAPGRDATSMAGQID